MNIAVIPARGGSKRIPRKNIKDFCGRPMVCWAIDIACKSGLFDHIIVSTEDAEIARIAKACGAEVPFLRPSELADDHTGTVPVIQHAAEDCLKRGWNTKHICCIYPCVPFLQTDDLLKSRDLLLAQKADFVFPVTAYHHPVQRAMRMLSSGRMQFANPDHALSRTQDLEILYHDTGQFYWGTLSAWLEGRKMHAGIGYCMPSWRVIDIDTMDDWKRAELNFKTLQETR